MSTDGKLLNKDMKRIREISMQAEEVYKDAVKLGEHAANAFRDLSDSKKNSHRSQMTGLENIAESALKVSDVLDYIKRQTARFEYWRKQYDGSTNPKVGFGEALREYLEKDIHDRRDDICKRLDIGNTIEEDKYHRQQIYLQLIRQFIRSIVVHYEYRVKEGEKGSNGATHTDR